MAINIDHQKDIISANSGVLTVDQTGALVLPKGNTSERPSAPVEAMVRYNSDTTKLEQYINGAWIDISVSSIGDLDDVDITTTPPSNGYILSWDAANNKFVPNSPGGAVLATSSIDDLGDVDTTGKANNYVLSWIDATQQWEPRSVAAAQGNLTEGDAIAFAIALGG